jgi:prevent-host-death family protein
MTCRDYLVVMRRVPIAELKAKLSEYLRHVRRGESFVILDRNSAIATISPYDSGGEPIKIRRARGATELSKVPLPSPIRLRKDVVALLLEERKQGR